MENPTYVEVLYMMLADALFSCNEAEPVGVARNRVIGRIDQEELDALTALINERRKLYTEQPPKL